MSAPFRLQAGRQSAQPGAEPLLRVRGLSVSYPREGGTLRRRSSALVAVDGVDLEVGRGETLGLVGESGCGKTTLGRAILRLLEPTAGSVVYDPGGDRAPVELLGLPERALRELRRELQIVFQDPDSSLNPRKTVFELLGEPLRVHGLARGSELEDRVAELADLVGLGTERMGRRPHEFSGGERQRIGIARALVLRPRFVVCDEVTSALDVSIQAQILNLMADLRDELELSYLFISHDLSVVRHLADRVAVMYFGRIVEVGRVDEIFEAPAHPYTRALLEAVPRMPSEALANAPRPAPLAGDVPSAADPPGGCPFHTRCPLVEDLCRRERPPRVRMSPTQAATCHLSSGPAGAAGESGTS